ncbi:MAG: hypothetical protein ABW106_11900 [Steroidobacteraceae bacterium]
MTKSYIRFLSPPTPSFPGQQEFRSADSQTPPSSRRNNTQGQFMATTATLVVEYATAYAADYLDMDAHASRYRRRDMAIEWDLDRAAARIQRYGFRYVFCEFEFWVSAFCAVMLQQTNITSTPNRT